MKLTLLQLVQDMLSAIDAEKVSAVGETDEADMCVQITNRAYEEIIERVRWRHLKQLTSLTSSAILNQMVAPDGVIAIDPSRVYYNDTLLYYMVPEDFLDYTISRDVTASDVEIVGNVKVYNDRDPVYFTSFDDYTLVFDAMPDNTNGLVGADSTVLAYVGHTSRLTADGDIFNLPRQAFPALEKLCISIAKSELQADTTEGRKLFVEFKGLMAALKRNARLVDQADDMRRWIIPRRTRGMYTTRIYK